MRRFWILLALAISCTQASVAQRAQLPYRGRTLERRPPVSAPSIRRLPRAGDGASFGPGALRAGSTRENVEQWVGRRRVLEPPRFMPLSRLRVADADTPMSDDPRPLRALFSAAADRGTARLASSAILSEAAAAGSTAEVPNRWNASAAAHNGVAADPYNRNRLKGDYPIIGRKIFLDVSGTSATSMEYRRLPAATQPSSDQAGQYGFFSHGGALSMQQNFRVGLSLFHGSAGFKPVDWEVKVTPEFNLNYLLAQQNGIINIDVRPGTSRFDTHIGMQELYFEKRLFSDGAQYDFTSVRAGIQRFTSDFRGFVFSDEQPGARLFGTLANNKVQYNLAMFQMLEKDTNSGLNTWQRRHQTVYAANLYRFDVRPGYNLNFSVLYNNDQPSFLIDHDGFLVRPAPLGTPLAHKVRAAYAGISGDGHLGRIGISHAFYQAFGRDDFNPIAGRAVHINAQLAALELSYESDWKKFKASVFYTSGQRRLDDSQARGFDGIVPNQQFAGGGFLGNPDLADRGLLNNAFLGGGINFLNREAIPLTGTAAFLFGPNSLMPTLRPGLFEGQSNFVNPGVWIYNAGFDAKVTPKLQATVNVNYLIFDRTEVLEGLLFQSGIHRAIGFDAGVGWKYRPKLNENIVLIGGIGILRPRAGFENLFTIQSLYSGFMLARFQF